MQYHFLLTRTAPQQLQAAVVSSSHSSSLHRGSRAPWKAPGELSLSSPEHYSWVCQPPHSSLLALMLVRSAPQHANYLCSCTLLLMGVYSITCNSRHSVQYFSCTDMVWSEPKHKKTCHQLATCLCWQTGYSLQVVCQGLCQGSRAWIITDTIILSFLVNYDNTKSNSSPVEEELQ